MVLFGFSLLPAGKPGRDEIENTTPTITIIPIITDIVATNLTEGISSLHSRSEEHTSELQSQSNLVCRLLLEKKKTKDFQLTLSVLPSGVCPCPSLLSIVPNDDILRNISVYLRAVHSESRQLVLVPSTRQVKH